MLSICLTVALNCQNIEKDPQRISKIKPFIDQYNWKEISFPQCSFDATKNKLDCYRGKDCMKRFCKDLKVHATERISYEKNKMIPLTDEQNKSYEKQKVCYICKEEYRTDDDNKKYHKVRDHFHYTEKYRGAAHNFCNLRYKTPKEIPGVFHNSSTNDYHFVIKELAK